MILCHVNRDSRPCFNHLYRLATLGERHDLSPCSSQLLAPMVHNSKSASHSCRSVVASHNITVFANIPKILQCANVACSFYRADGGPIEGSFQKTVHHTEIDLLTGFEMASFYFSEPSSTRKCVSD